MIIVYQLKYSTCLLYAKYKDYFFENKTYLVSLANNIFFMKKLLLSTSFVLTVGILASSCNNGKYDANPSTDLSMFVNPSNPKGGNNTSFNWGGNAPMSCELSGGYWQANDAIFQTVTLTSQSGQATDFIEIIGTKNGVAKTGVHLYLRAQDVVAGNEARLSWYDEGQVYGGNYYLDVDSVYNAVINRPKYSFVSGYAGEGRARILDYDGQHIKGLFYMMPRNSLGFFVNIQKGYFDITK